MSREDFYHKHVREALEAAGWYILRNQFELPFYNSRISIDLAVERITVDGNKETLFVEVKSFRKRENYFNDFQKGLGQYLLYREIMLAEQVSHSLYLAVPEKAYRSFFQDSIVKKLIEAHQIKVLTFNPLTRTLVRWIH